MPKRFLQRFARIDNLIQRKATGKPVDFARRLDISESTLYEYLSVMKNFGAPIRYCSIRCTYYYEEDGKFKVFFEKNITPVLSE